ncbi:4-hydroxy-tetrahydrodipicolinate synthase [Flavobacteriales bacterium]|nr:4-hydroxy-tetrahydrodipicolinate synthase [Flavobacteriales bacterium]
MHSNINGTGVALVTPFKNDYSIDFEGLSKLVNHCVDGGIDFLVVLGTTGESVTLSSQEKSQVLEHIKMVNQNRLPIVLGIGGNNTTSVIESFSNYNLEGVDAVLSVSPSYNKPTQEGIYQHFKAISEESPLPIILYNVPGRTSSNMTAETTLRLANDFENIIAIKEASGDMSQIMDIINCKPSNFKVLSGDDAITLPIIAMGGEGVISVLGQGLPNEFSSMVNFAMDNQIESARNINYKILGFVNPLFAEGNPAGIKKMLKLLEICDDGVRLPLVKASEKIELNIKKGLANLKS